MRNPKEDRSERITKFVFWVQDVSVFLEYEKIIHKPSIKELSVLFREGYGQQQAARKIAEDQSRPTSASVWIWMTG